MNVRTATGLESDHTEQYRRAWFAGFPRELWQAKEEQAADGRIFLRPQPSFANERPSGSEEGAVSNRDLPFSCFSTKTPLLTRFNMGVKVAPRDPKQHFFAKDFLAEQMELMTNLEPLRRGQISASHMGPENMWRAVYRIMEVEGSRPERQLVPVYSCLVETKPGGEKLASVVTVRYESGRAVAKRHEAGKMDIRAALSKCNLSTR